MFQLTYMEQVVRIKPNLFHLKLNDAISNELNRRLANKVVLNKGLCIALYDIVHLGDSFILPGDGSSHTRVKFRFITFRPTIEEILLGKIRSCSEAGVHVSLGFFDDILIPPKALQHPSRFDETEQAWVWEYTDDEGEKHSLFMDAGEAIRFRVIAETFKETSPTQSSNGVIDVEASNVAQEPKVPYSITGSINEPALGLLSWWRKQDKEQEEEDAE